MATSYPVRQYIVFDAGQLLGRPVIRPLETGEVEKALVAALGSGLRFTVQSLPTARFVPYEHVETPFIPESVAVLASPSEADARAVRDAVEDLIAREGGKRISDIGADPAIGLADYSFPGSVDVGLFGTRDEAHRLVGINRLPGGLNLTGNGVNVIVVDFRLRRLAYSIRPMGRRLATVAQWTRSRNDDRGERTARHYGRPEHPRSRATGSDLGLAAHSATADQRYWGLSCERTGDIQYDDLEHTANSKPPRGPTAMGLHECVGDLRPSLRVPFWGLYGEPPRAGRSAPVHSPYRTARRPKVRHYILRRQLRGCLS